MAVAVAAAAAAAAEARVSTLLEAAWLEEERAAKLALKALESAWELSTDRETAGGMSPSKTSSSSLLSSSSFSFRVITSGKF